MTKEKNSIFKKPIEPVSTRDKVIIFFFDFIFVLLIGKHYFANLEGSPKEKSTILKWYYFGLAFWFCLVLGIAYLEGDLM